MRHRVVRYGIGRRTKLKVKTTHPSIVQIHRRCKTPKKEVKLKESKDLRAFSSTLKAILLKDDIDAFRKIREVLKSHKLDDEEELLGGVFFSGCKLQLKPLKWEDDETTEVQVVLKCGVLTELVRSTRRRSARISTSYVPDDGRPRSLAIACDF